MCSCCHCWFTQSGARSPFKKQEFIEFMNHLCSDLKYHLLQSCCFFWFSWLIGNHTSAQMCQRNLMESILILQPLWIASVEHMSILKYLPQNKHNMKNMIDADWEIASGSTSDWKGEINTVQREQHIRKEDKGMKYDTYLPFVFFTSGELAIDVFYHHIHTSLKKKKVIWDCTVQNRRLSVHHWLSGWSFIQDIWKVASDVIVLRSWGTFFMIFHSGIENLQPD